MWFTGTKFTPAIRDKVAVGRVDCGPVAIEAILFDADGVIQRPGEGWRVLLAKVAGDARVDEFLAEVFAAEELCLSGATDLRHGLFSVLARWKSESTPDDVLSALNDIQPDGGILATISSLRRAGLLCCLATNQQVHRARYMSETLGYADAFDHEFYSCDIGAAKPQREYFEAILHAIDVPPRNVLLVDDDVANVVAAREAGVCAARFEANSAPKSLSRVLADFNVETA